VNHLPDDPHFKARNIAEIVDHPLVGDELTVNLPWKFSGFSPDYGRAPYLGEHTAWILKEILSKSDAEIEELKEKEII
jgi:crotonobetainyl-CoA:carnitine CoA-transferase CaiB-like acyl-CoA transferase